LLSTATIRRMRTYAIAAAVSAVALATPSDAAAQRMLIRELLPSPVSGQNGMAPQTLFTAADLFSSDFLTAQLRHERVLNARIETRFGIKQLFDERGIAYPAAELFLRVFKRERSMELWVRAHGAAEFELLKTYAICALAGGPGPKRRQGDNQTPEGFYEINHFNPNSSFLLSMHINYPNRSDRLLGAGNTLGGDIFIHGGCQTEGCIAVTDEGIKELYWLGVEARAAGQRTIPVHIFPFRLTEDDITIAASVFAEAPELIRFWRSLQPGYDFFERTRRLPAITIDARGYYALNGADALQVGSLPGTRPSGGQ
jgi:murein L,D-transpeptidase YafK